MSYYFVRKYYVLRPLELQFEILVYFCHKYILQNVGQKVILKFLCIFLNLLRLLQINTFDPLRIHK